MTNKEYDIAIKVVRLVGDARVVENIIDALTQPASLLQLPLLILNFPNQKLPPRRRPILFFLINLLSTN